MPNIATPISISTATTYSGTAARASVCGGMLAKSHISTIAKPKLNNWLVTRGTL